MHYMHYKDYIHHDFYVYSPVLLTQYLGHCWHTPCTELYILRIRCITFPGCWETPPPLPQGGGPSGWWGGCGGPCSYISAQPPPIISISVAKMPMCSSQSPFAEVSKPRASCHQLTRVALCHDLKWLWMPSTNVSNKHREKLQISIHLRSMDP